MRLSNVLIVLGMASLTGAASLAGCGGDDSSASGSEASGTTSGGDPNCELTNPVCTSVPSECVALKDNSSQTKFGLRMAQLTVTKPDVLSSGLVAKLVAEGVSMNLPQCNLNGTGTFSWLIQFDTMTGKALTGGASPQTDPTKGYCFLDIMVDAFHIQPIEVDSNLADGKFSADVGDLIVPIFIGSDPSAKPITLPLHKARLYDGTLSADNNCIGQHNAAGLDPNNLCLPDEDHPAFINGAKLDGFITIEEADQVIVTDAGNQSLCVILSGDPGMYGTGASPNVCKRDAGTNEILLKGDWCAATNAAADATCMDAFALGAEFAANAVEISGICP